MVNSASQTLCPGNVIVRYCHCYTRKEAVAIRGDGDKFQSMFQQHALHRCKSLGWNVGISIQAVLLEGRDNFIQFRRLEYLIKFKLFHQCRIERQFLQFQLLYILDRTEQSMSLLHVRALSVSEIFPLVLLSLGLIP